jgi:hypothetical protein
VHGIDLSPDMVAELRAKPDSDDIGVTIGDFATTRADWNRAPFTDDSIMHVSVWEETA